MTARLPGRSSPGPLRCGRSAGEHDVHGLQVRAAADGDPGRPADQRLILCTAGSATTTRSRPGPVTMVSGTVALAVLGQRGGQPAEVQLAQLGQRPGPDPAGLRRPGRVAVAAGQPVVQRFGGWRPPTRSHRRPAPRGPAQSVRPGRRVASQHRA